MITCSLNMPYITFTFNHHNKIYNIFVYFVCAEYVLDEVENAGITNINIMAINKLIKALEVGKATGWVGSLNINVIDTVMLDSRIQMAKEVTIKTRELSELIETAEIILALRAAQKSRDPNSVGLIVSFTQLFVVVCENDITFNRYETH